LAAAGKKSGDIHLNDVLQRINNVARKCERLIIEGSGGLLVPLAENLSVADLIAALDCEVVIIARNRLGTINHTLLTIKVLESYGVLAKNMRVVLMSPRNPDLSARTNPGILSRLLHPVSLEKVPFLGPNAASPRHLKKIYPKVRTVMTKLV